MVGPYQSKQIFQHGVLFFDDPKTVFQLTAVCTTYRQWSRDPAIVKQLCKRFGGIPQVVSLDGSERRNPQFDLMVLHKVTIGTCIIEKIFGRVLGEVPPISEYWFDKIQNNVPDPFEPELSFRKNFVVMVDPAFIERTYDQDTPLKINEEGNLTKIDPHQAVDKHLTIPFTLKNMAVLSAYPKSKEYLPVVAMGQKRIIRRVSSPEKLGVVIMRKTPFKENLMSSDFSEQVSLMEQRAPGHGYQAVSVRQRFLYDVISVFTTETCPDTDTQVHGPETYTVNNDAEGGYDRNVGIGGYDLNTRRFTRFGELFCDDDVGIVPGAPADVPGSVNLERLTIE